MSDYVVDEKPYPYWEEVYLFFKERGFKFTCDIESKDDRPMVLVRFSRYHADNIAEVVAELLIEQFDENIVYEAEEFDLWIDQLPQWYPVARPDLEYLVKDLLTYLDEEVKAGREMKSWAQHPSEISMGEQQEQRAQALFDRLNAIFSQED